jgi:hypothetical protein
VDQSPATLPSVEHAAPVSQWLPLLRETLAHEGRFRWPVEGRSMWPTLQPGSEIEIAPLLHAPALGDVIVFVAEGALVVHRLVHRSRGLLVTQGDGRTRPDRPVHPGDVLGRVIAACQDGERYWPTRYAGPIAMWWVFRYHWYRVQAWGKRVVWKSN